MIRKFYGNKKKIHLKNGISSEIVEKKKTRSRQASFDKFLEHLNKI